MKVDDETLQLTDLRTIVFQEELVQLEDLIGRLERKVELNPIRSILSL